MTLKGTDNREKIATLAKALVMCFGGLAIAVFGFLMVKEGADDAITGAVVFSRFGFCLSGFCCVFNNIY